MLSLLSSSDQPILLISMSAHLFQMNSGFTPCKEMCESGTTLNEFILFW